MKTDSRMKKITSYLKELTIVTAGVLIALFLSNLIENNQARKYQIASIEAVKNEIDSNYNILKVSFERHTALRDTIDKYRKDHILISDLISKAGGLHGGYLKNTGLDFYTKNQINSIDFEMMSMLMNMKSTSKLIEIKMEKLMDYLYPNLFVDTEESKMLVILYLNNVLNSETQLMLSYVDFFYEYVENKCNTE